MHVCLFDGIVYEVGGGVKLRSIIGEVLGHVYIGLGRVLMLPLPW